MAYIPEEKLQEIRDAAPIEEVVGQYVRLERRGKNLVGLCPFHPDTRPSLTVSPEKGIFYCFGCHTGGNVISFVMHFHKLGFAEAVSELARRYGILLSTRELGPEEGRRARKRELFLDLYREAHRFYEAQLEGSGGQRARDYLARRGLTPEVVRQYRLGYAPEGWDSLRRHLQSRGLPLEAAAEAGLLAPRADGGFYDRFRDRVIFPIFDRQERVVAFGGRSLGEAEPKYLNSPESPIYSKGRLLFGLPQAKEAVRSQDLALVVEGYLDLLALRVHGVDPVLASLGTALTREQVRLLKSLVSRVVLVFDGDEAGVRAMCRAFPLFLQEGLPVRVIALPEGLDPDSYVHRHGPRLFSDPWETAQPWLAFLLDHLQSVHGPAIEGRLRLVEALKPYFQAMAEPLEQGLWLKYAAERLKVEEGDLRLSLLAAGGGRREPGGIPKLALNLERRLLRFVLHHPQAVPAEELAQWAEEMETPAVQVLLRQVASLRLARKTPLLGFLLDHLDDEALKQEVCALLLTEGEFTQLSPELAAAEWRRALARRRLKRAREALTGKLAQAAKDAHPDHLLALLSQRQEIDRQLEALNAPSQTIGEQG